MNFRDHRDSSRLAHNALRVVIGLLFAVGLISRAAPLLNRGDRLFWQFPTEDGYLMLTIARNLAIGKGMSTADGTIPTNGTQPLCTFLYAGCYRLAGGDKTAGLYLVHAFQMLIGILTAWMIYRLARLAWANPPNAAGIAGLAAGLWYASPLSVAHTQNGLETGLYALMVICALYVFSRFSAIASWSALQSVLLGVLLGVTFWARNDAVLLIAAICIVRLAPAIRRGRVLFRSRTIEVLITGCTSVLVALPWMIHNRVHFGSIMPISGIAESLRATWGGNLRYVPPALAEYLTAILPIPHALETKLPILFACVVIILIAGVLAFRLWRAADSAQRSLIAVALLYTAGLCGFYGLYFGAGWFVSRYLFPAFGLLVTIPAIVLGVLTLSISRSSRPLAIAAPAIALIIAAGLNLRLYEHGSNHQHKQVVEWVTANVPDDAWVAATQTGTLGYFHDRAINLDGKVNPEALQALRQGRIPEYILSKPIAYIADWAGHASWARLSILAPYYVVLVEDRDRNLAVLARRDTTPTTQPIASADRHHP